MSPLTPVPSDVSKCLISSTCNESFPSRHEVKIILFDGREKTGCLTHAAICSLMKEIPKDRFFQDDSFLIEDEKQFTEEDEKHFYHAPSTTDKLASDLLKSLFGGG